MLTNHQRTDYDCADSLPLLVNKLSDKDMLLPPPPASRELEVDTGDWLGNETSHPTLRAEATKAAVKDS